MRLRSLIPVTAALLAAPLVVTSAAAQAAGPVDTLSVSNGTLTVTAAAGMTNSLEIGDDQGKLVITEYGVTPAPGGGYNDYYPDAFNVGSTGCTMTGNDADPSGNPSYVECDPSALTGLKVLTGDLDDDVILDGSLSTDIPGITTRYVDGGSGNDAIAVDDGNTSINTVDCGPGEDSIDWNDENDHVSDCEEDNYGDVDAPSTLPVATTKGASNITTTSATVAGSGNPNGFDASYQIEYGTSSTALTSVAPATPAALGSGSTAVTESVGLTGLTPSTTYYYRFVTHAPGMPGATSTVINHGAVQSFTTPATDGGGEVVTPQSIDLTVAPAPKVAGVAVGFTVPGRASITADLFVTKKVAKAAHLNWKTPLGVASQTYTAAGTYTTTVALSKKARAALKKWLRKQRHAKSGRIVPAAVTAVPGYTGLAVVTAGGGSATTFSSVRLTASTINRPTGLNATNPNDDDPPPPPPPPCCSGNG